VLQRDIFMKTGGGAKPGGTKRLGEATAFMEKAFTPTD